jgi:hypothetical protein
VARWARGLRRAPGQANVSLVRKTRLGVLALTAAAVLGTVSATAGAPRTPRLTGAVKIVFAGHARQVLHDYKEWILQSDNECYYDKTTDESATLDWSASFAAVPLKALARSAGRAPAALGVTASGAASGLEVRGDCGSDDVPPGWVQTITCSGQLQFGSPSLRLSRQQAGRAVLSLQAPPASLPTPSPCAIVPRNDQLLATVKVGLAALARLKTGKSLTVRVGTGTASGSYVTELNCSFHPAPYEGTEIADDCHDTLTWSGTVTFLKT